MGTKSEPILTVATITGAVSAVIALMVAFGVEFNEQQTAAIMGVVGVIAPFIVWGVARQWTVPAGKAEAKVEQAHEAGATGQPKPKL